MDTQLTTTTQHTSQIDPLVLIEGADLGDATKAKYTRVMGQYLATGGDLLDAGALGEFAKGLSNSRRAHLRAAFKIYTDKLCDLTNATANPLAPDVVEREAQMSQAERVYKSLAKAIQVKKPKGHKAHTWLSQTQVKALYKATNGGIEGERDRVALGLMVAAGLRCSEAVNLTFDNMVLQPIKNTDKFRTVLTFKGKGDKDREVPISDDLANLIDIWGRRIGGQGRIIRALGRNLEPGESMSTVGLFKLVRRYGEKIGKPELAAHDLRRTFAQLAHAAGTPLTQISIILGHESLETTRLYLDLSIDIETTPSDFIPWN